MRPLKKFIEDFEASMEEVEPGALSAETEFKGLKSWDSLAILTVTDTVEFEYGVLLRKDDFTDSVTLAQLYHLIEAKLGA
jgi:acyl carrier protein